MTHKPAFLIVLGLVLCWTMYSRFERTSRHLEEFEHTTSRRAHCARLGGTLVVGERGALRCLACSGREGVSQ